MHSWRAELGDGLAGRSVLVTGSTGFIGWHLCEALVGLGADVHGLARSAAAGALPEGCRPQPLDLEDEPAVERLLAGLRPQLVYHLAGRVTARQDLELVLPMLRQNLAGTVHLLLAATRTGVERLVVVGSSEEGDDPLADPTSPYAAAKAGATVWALMFGRTYGLPVCVVRPFFVYGPRQEPGKLIPTTLRSLLQGERPRVESAQRVCDFLYVADAVRGLLLAGLRPEVVGAVLDLGTGRGTRILDLVSLLIELTGADVAPLALPEPERAAGASRTADPASAERLLGWRPSWSLRDGLRETIDWYEAHLTAVARNG